MRCDRQRPACRSFSARSFSALSVCMSALGVHSGATTVLCHTARSLWDGLVHHNKFGAQCPLWAITGLTHRNKTHHSITLSARSTSDDGTSTPIALAVLRLTTNSNL